MFRVVGFLLLLVLTVTELKAQTKSDIELAQVLFEPELPNHPNYRLLATNGSTNELKALFSGLFLFYKKFISSQDKPSCSFTPSCSVYALESIQSNGLLIGSMDAFDRLTRCNPLAHKQHKKDEQTHKLSDPINSHK